MEMAGKDIAVEFDVPDITIQGDENLLHQVWSNIFTNSIKFSNDGGTIEFFVEELESSVIISISDNGIGMEKKKWIVFLIVFIRWIQREQET